MLLPSFDYHEPWDIAEAASLLASLGERGELIAGGTDVLIRLQAQGPHDRTALIGLGHIRDLAFLEAKDGILRLGALTCVLDLEQSALLVRTLPALVDAARVFASVQIRALATLGGNLCNASPAADLAPPLLAAQAEVVLRGVREQRQVPLDDFCLGPGRTARSQDEVLCEVRFRVPGFHSGSAYLRFSPRRSMDIAFVSVAAYVTLATDHRRIERVTIALGAVAPTVIRVRRAEEFLAGAEPEPKAFEAAGALASAECSPISDVRASAEYRRDLVRVLVPRCLRVAVDRALGNVPESKAVLES